MKERNKDNLVLSVNNLSYIKKKKLLLKGVSFSLQKGEHMLLAGPSNSGKTTLVSIIAGKIKEGYQGKIYLKYPPVVMADIFLYKSLPNRFYSIFKGCFFKKFSTLPWETFKFLKNEAFSLVDSKKLTIKEKEIVLTTYGVLLLGPKLILSDGLFAKIPTICIPYFKEAFLLLANQQGLSIVNICRNYNLALKYADRMVALERGEVLYDSKLEKPWFVSQRSINHQCYL